MTISDYIPKGKDNAIHLSDLCGLFNCSDYTMKSAIRNARIAGSVICSCEQGYYRPETNEELHEFLNMMNGQALSRLEIIDLYKDVRINEH